jgi:hypothetical protein
MSVKFEKETVKLSEGAAAALGESTKDDLVHKVGEALTKGSGANGYLAVSDAQLEHDSERN